MNFKVRNIYLNMLQKNSRLARCTLGYYSNPNPDLLTFFETKSVDLFMKKSLSKVGNYA